MEVQRIMESCISMAEDNRNKQRDSPIQFSEVMGKLLESQNTSIDSFEALQQKYGEMTYHVGDASQFYNWDSNDFPVWELFKENVDADMLCRRQGVEQIIKKSRFREGTQDGVKSIEDGSRSIFIHPTVHEKIKNDPVYAQKIFERIDNYFQNDIRINETLLPGCTRGIIQFVSIDADGTIGRTCTITNSVSNIKREDSLDGLSKRKTSPELLNAIRNTYGKNDTESLNGSYVSNEFGIENENYHSIWGCIYGELMKKRLVNGDVKI